MEQVVVQAMQWAHVKDIQAIQHGLSDRDADCLHDIRSVLEKHGALERFGITLLHKHFDLGENECLLETVDVEARVLTVRPVLKQNLPQAVQTQWKLANREPLQWCEAWCNYSGGTHHHGHQFHVRREA